MRCSATAEQMQPCPFTGHFKRLSVELKHTQKYFLSICVLLLEISKFLNQDAFMSKMP